MSDSEGSIKSPAVDASPRAGSPIVNGDDASASGDDDLFGDDGGDIASDDGDNKGGDDDDGQLSDQPLSEHGLDSDDDDDEARYGEDGEPRSRQQQQQMREEVLMDVDIFRHRTPKSSDGNVRAQH